MDPLTHLLDGPRARRAFALRVVMEPQWSIDVRDQAPLTVIAMMGTGAWLAAGNNLYELQPGDVALVRGPEPYLVTDDLARDADVIVHPGQLCTSPSGADLQLSMKRGIRTWGNTAAGQTTMLIGTYETDAEVSSAVTAALPRVAVVPASEIDPALVRFLDGEIASGAPGQGSMIDRLLDVLLVHAIRAWAKLNPRTARGWLAGSHDPLVAQALALFHETPAQGWTLDSLSSRLNVSRGTLAGRFRTVVGEPPMTYLANWRMLLASELLANPELTTAQIATTVGYGSPFALSSAFKRRYGLSPTGYRRLWYQGPAAATN